MLLIRIGLLPFVGRFLSQLSDTALHCRVLFTQKRRRAGVSNPIPGILFAGGSAALILAGAAAADALLISLAGGTAGRGPPAAQPPSHGLSPFESEFRRSLTVAFERLLTSQKLSE